MIDAIGIALAIFVLGSGYFVVTKILFIRRQMLLRSETGGGASDLHLEVLLPEVKEVPLKKLLLGIHDLEQYVREYEPDWIIGVHPGGRLLSAYIADKLAFPPHRCIFAHTEPQRVSGITYRGWNEPLNGGKILIVDDISRSGMTLRAVNSDLHLGAQGGKYSFSEARFSVMLLLDQSNRVFEPHWYRFITRNSHVTFPWSGLSERIKNELNQRGKRLVFDKSMVDLHELLATDFGAALKVAKLSIESRDLFDMLLRKGKLYSYLTAASDAGKEKKTTAA